MKTILTISMFITAVAGWPALADTKAVYDKECAKCHGADGKGDTKIGKKVGAKDYTDPKVVDAMKDEVAFKSIKEGLKEKGSDKTLMKAFDALKDQEIKDLIAYMRTFKRK